MEVRSKDGCFRLHVVDQWERIVAAASRTVGHDDSVTAAYVVVPRRPTYGEMPRFRGYERPGEIRMSLASHDRVSVRAQQVKATRMGSRQARIGRNRPGGASRGSQRSGQPGCTSCSRSCSRSC